MDIFFNSSTRELNDDAVINALKGAVDMYENGEILEVRGLLLDIIYAIDEFDNSIDEFEVGW